MNKFFSQIITVLRSLNRNQKIILGISAGAILLGLSFLGYYTQRVEFVNLYVNIDTEEAGRITKKLDEWKQKYSLEGTTIKVPLKDKDRLRLELASSKLAPKGGITGFEIFDTTKLAITDYERRINYVRALQGELSRTIKSIEGIEDARVLLVMPEKKLYMEEQREVSASVKLQLAPFTTLDASQIVGIVQLVSSAVEGLPPDNVNIVDNRGNILTDIEELRKGETTGLAAKQLELQRAEARKLEKAIRRTLAKCLIEDKIEVLVTCNINFDKIESKHEKYTSPENIALTDDRIREGVEKVQLRASDEKVIERFEGEGSVPGGPPGVEAQMPGYKGMTSAKGPMTYSKDELRSNYLANKEEIMTVKSPEISKLSVAVWIDGIYERDASGFYKFDKNNHFVYIPRGKDEMQKYENLVWASIGAEKDKEYQGKEFIVQVENVQFDRTSEWLAALAQREAQKRRLLAMAAGAGFLALAIFVALIFMFMVRRKTLAQEKLLREKELAALNALRERIPHERDEGFYPTGEGEEKKILPPSRAAEGKEVSIEELAREVAINQPDAVANLFRTWLENDMEETVE
ncbi:MAG: flagellar basal-body MS-ring/collar protein FliF [bacterium]|nr:flagellar basal-body MS-ring/collar protein FliF [bacterium]